MDETPAITVQIRNKHSPLQYVLFLFVCCGYLALPSCGPATPPPDPSLVSRGSPVRTTVTGDWDDLNASLQVGLTDAECAEVEELKGGVDLRVWRVEAITHEFGTLRIWRDRSKGQNARGSWTLVLEARIGRDGDPEREARLVAGVARRLKELAGVDWAPLDED